MEFSPLNTVNKNTLFHRPRRCTLLIQTVVIHGLLEELVNTNLGSSRPRHQGHSNLVTTSPIGGNASSNSGLSRTISQPRGLNILSSINPSVDANYQSSTQIQASKSMSYAPQRIPTALAPGMDPVVAREISDKTYDAKRASDTQGPEDPPRDRNQSSAQYQLD